MTQKLQLILLLLLTISGLYAQVPVANFTANVTSGCSPVTVTFTDQSSGSPQYWNWDFGNGQLSNLQNPTISFGTPGTYTITLVVRNADGTNGITKTDFITVNPSPQANFSANITTGCAPSTIQFTDRSVPNAGNLVSWNWDFGDGGTSTQQHPSHQYTATGFYTVTLEVVSSTGCRSISSIGRYIRIVPGIIPEFSFANPGTCRGPFTVNFSNLTSGPGILTYQWDFGNGTNGTDANPAAVYNSTGNYTVNLTATSEYGCSASIQKPITVSGTTTSFNSPDTVCLNTTVSFENISSPVPVSSVWNFGNGQTSTSLNDTSYYSSAGSYTIKLVNMYDNCTDSAIKTLVVEDRPAVNFTAPVTTACQGPLTVNFTDASAGAVSWLWNFGDGGSSTVQNPSHTYTSAGQYDVTLTIATARGCTNTTTQSSFVRIIPPTISFRNAPNGGCIPFDFAPIATVNAIDGGVSYAWNYGDGFTATTAAPSSGDPTGPLHTYSLAGSYDLSVTVTTTGGCTATSTLVNGIRTGTIPTAHFSVTPTDACASQVFSFTDLSTATPSVDEWYWDFGDGSSSSNQYPLHHYSDSGSFNVRLTAFNNKCPATSAIQVVHVKGPIAQFSYLVNCNNKRLVNFTNESKVDPSMAGSASYTWEFGDGNSTTTSTPTAVSHTYASLQVYSVVLTVATSECTHTDTLRVELVGDVADFSVSDNTPCKNDPVRFTAISSDPAHVTSYEWAINGGAYFSGGATMDTSFPANGSYTIALRIADLNGCTDVKTIGNAVTVSGPVANFSPVTKGGCGNTTVVFNDLSTATASIKSRTFDFGDGNSQTYTNAGPFTHTYPSTGRFVVRLTVVDNNDCMDTYVSTDTIWITQPKAGFTSDFTTICPLTNISFKDTSSGSGLHYSWDFGDGNGSTDSVGIHQYTVTSGTFTVKLVITDTAGCKDSVTKANYVTVKAPKPAFEARDTSSVCTLLEAKFRFLGSDYESFYWDFGDGSTSTLENPNHFFNNYGDYTVKLYLIGYGGCIDSAMDTIHVYDPYANTALVYSPLNACNSLLVDFDITTPPTTKFTFYFGDGYLDNTQTKTLQHFYAQPGSYGPSVLLQDSTGCQATVGGRATIQIIGALPLFGTSKKAFCDEGTVSFTNYTVGNDPVVSRTWDFGDGTNSTDTDPTHTFTQPGTYVVKHTVTTQSNCTNTITDTIRIYATPSPRIGGDSIVCMNTPLTLLGELAYADTTVTWSWDLGPLGKSSEQNPVVQYPTAGSYPIAVEVTNKLGCKGDTTKRIRVPAAPVITVTGSTTIPVGMSLTLPVSYSENIATYVWTPAKDLSCTDCPNPVANPKFSTLYTLTVTDVYGCTLSKDIEVKVICNSENYFVPNTFSPNGDGVNDVFMPRGSSITRVNRMQVFNRWGELVYEKRNFMVNDASAGWNGTYKGKPSNSDVYIYLIEFVCDNASVVPFRGNVTLLR